MRVAVFSTKPYDEEFLGRANEQGKHDLTFFRPALTAQTALLAAGYEAVCIFVNDDGSRAVLEELHRGGVRFVALRCAGYNNVDVAAARELGIAVARVPVY